MSTMIRGVEGVKKVSEMLGDYQQSLIDYQEVNKSSASEYIVAGSDCPGFIDQSEICKITREELMSVFQARIKDNAVKLENIGIKVADAYSEGK